MRGTTPAMGCSASRTRTTRLRHPCAPPSCAHQVARGTHSGPGIEGTGDLRPPTDPQVLCTRGPLGLLYRSPGRPAGPGCSGSRTYTTRCPAPGRCMAMTDGEPCPCALRGPSRTRRLLYTPAPDIGRRSDCRRSPCGRPRPSDGPVPLPHDEFALPIRSAATHPPPSTPRPSGGRAPRSATWQPHRG